MHRTLLVVVALIVAGCTAPADLQPASEVGTDPGPEAPVAGPVENETVVPPAANATGARPEHGPVAPDPLVAGARAVESVLYDLGVVLVNDEPRGVPVQYPIQIRGEVHYPEGEGAHPVIVLAHGRHATCWIMGWGDMLGAHVCPSTPVTEPIGSYTGYAGLAELMASHGYVVASVDINQVNDRDQTCVPALYLCLIGDYGARARAEAIYATLAALREVHESGEAGPAFSLPELQGRIDLSRIGLMGHSRGGEGVVTAVEMDPEWGFDAVFALAPTDFAGRSVEVPFATLLPYCDGDVESLHGAGTFDRTRGRAPAAQYVAIGANHNWFNTVWTFDDHRYRGDDPWCSTGSDENGRDSEEDQRALGYGIMSAFLRRYVGGEEAFAPLVEGRSPLPSSMCPDGEGPCSGRLMTSWHPAEGVMLAADGAGEDIGFDEVDGCRGADCPGERTRGDAKQTYLEWSDLATMRYDIGAPVDARAFTFRAAVPLGEPDVRLEAMFVGETEATVTLAGAALRSGPGEDSGDTILNMVRVQVPEEVRPVASVTLRFLDSGSLQVADVMLEP